MSKREIIISPSILASDLFKLPDTINTINKSKAQWIHVDVMDGIFVPNITFGIPLVEGIRPNTKKVIDTHLMIREPSKYIEPFAKSGSDIISIHLEASNHINKDINKIKKLGCKAGVAINPHSGIYDIKYILSELDIVLIMSVNPGFHGQPFIESSINKIKDLKDMIIQMNSKAIIEVDGGLNDTNAKKIRDYVDAMVFGNFIFGSKNPLETINNIL